jgi:hypothetical protein
MVRRLRRFEKRFLAFLAIGPLLEVAFSFLVTDFAGLSERTQALAITTTGFPLTRRLVLLGPVEVARTSVFPDFDRLAGLIRGNVMTTIPFLNLAFILLFSSLEFCSKQVGPSKQAIP